MVPFRVNPEKNSTIDDEATDRWANSRMSTIGSLLRTACRLKATRRTAPIASGMITSAWPNPAAAPALDRPRMSAAMPGARSANPSVSNFGLTVAMVSLGRYFAARTRPMRQNGTFTQNMNRQLRWVRITPPTSGPRIGPTSAGSAMSVTARPSDVPPAERLPPGALHDARRQARHQHPPGRPLDDPPGDEGVRVPGQARPDGADQ